MWYGISSDYRRSILTRFFLDPEAQKSGPMTADFLAIFGPFVKKSIKSWYFNNKEFIKLHFFYRDLGHMYNFFSVSISI